MQRNSPGAACGGPVVLRPVRASPSFISAHRSWARCWCFRLQFILHTVDRHPCLISVARINKRNRIWLKLNVRWWRCLLFAVVWRTTTYHICRRISSRCLSSRYRPLFSSHTRWRSHGRQCHRPAYCRHCRRSCHIAVDTDISPSNRPATAHTARRNCTACYGTDHPCPAETRSTSGRPPPSTWRRRRRTDNESSATSQRRRVNRLSRVPNDAQLSTLAVQPHSAACVSHRRRVNRQQCKGARPQSLQFSNNR